MGRGIEESRNCSVEIMGSFDFGVKNAFAQDDNSDIISAVGEGASSEPQGSILRLEAPARSRRLFLTKQKTSSRMMRFN